jgi:uncharacterized delta-60 repeat protein
LEFAQPIAVLGVEIDMRRSGRFVLALAIVTLPALVGVSPATASPLEGRLDPTFGHGGIAYSPRFRRVVEDRLEVEAAEPDGDLVVGVRRTQDEVEEATSYSLIRLRADGSRAPDRGPPDPTESQVLLPDRSQVTQGDGGPGACADSVSTIRATTPDGSLDATFGEGGCVTVPFSVTWLAAEPDGDILVGGARQYASGKIFTASELALARLLPDGRLDPGFGHDGVVLALSEYGINQITTSFALSPGGEIFAVGEARPDESGLLAFTSAGRPDPRFGGSLGIRIPGGSPRTLPAADGTLTVLTRVAPAILDPPSSLRVTRIQADGTPDPTFGSGGVASIHLGEVDVPEGLGSTPDGGTLIALDIGSGVSCPASCAYRPALLRLTSAGNLESAYGDKGVVVPRAPGPPPIEASEPPGLSEPPSLSLLVGPDGKAYLSGGSYGRGGFIFAREPDGSADLDFGERGVVRDLPTLPSDARPVGLVLGPGGDVDVSAEGEPFRFGSESFVLPFRPDGALRGPPSRAPRSVPVAPLLSHLDHTLADGPDHFLALAEFELSPDEIVRFGPAGRDSGYGIEGAVTLPRDFIPIDLLHGLHDRLFVVGHLRGPSGYGVLALGPHGAPVHSYGKDGLRRLHLGPGSANRVVSGIVEPDGSLVLSGRLDGQAGAVRLLPDGKVDVHFGRAGRLKLLGRHTLATAAVSAGGRLVFECTRRYDGDRRASTFVAVSSDGLVDPSFGRDGRLPISRNRAPLAFLRSRHDLVTVSALPAPRGGVRLHAYLPDGLPDRRFGADGTLVAANRQTRPFKLVAAAVQKDGKVIVLGRIGHGAFRQRAEILRFR